jgi:hypothetical protein
LDLECSGTVHEPGPFNCPLFVNFFDGGYGELKMTVHGSGIAQKDANHAAKKP